MSDTRDTDLSGLVAGFAIGLFAGAALGLLLAPAQGHQTRAWIAEKGREAGRRARPLLHPQQVQAVLRNRGVRGLWEALNSAPVEERRV